MMDDKSFYAQFAQAAYKQNKTDIGRYKLVDSFSDSNSALWVYPAAHAMVFAIKGTSNALNVGSDILLFFNKLRMSPDFIREQQKLKRILATFKGFRISLTGHSLGGSIALELFEMYAKKLDRVFCYNMGTTFKMFFERTMKSWMCRLPLTRRLTSCKAKNRIMIYTSGFDAISLLSRPFATEHVSVRGMNPLTNHAVSNFTRNIDNTNNTDNPNIEELEGGGLQMTQKQWRRRKRAPSSWNAYVKDVYAREKRRNPNIQLKDVVSNSEVRKRYRELKRVNK